MAMQQELIDWKYEYRPYIRPIFQAYVRGYHHRIWPYIAQYLCFRILKFPLIWLWLHSSKLILQFHIVHQYILSWGSQDSFYLRYKWLNSMVYDGYNELVFMGVKNQISYSLWGIIL